VKGRLTPEVEPLEAVIVTVLPFELLWWAHGSGLPKLLALP